ncbi:MAG: TFIIB-type zinc ribbon-containing protein [Thermoplasmatota archaeon]
MIVQMHSSSEASCPDCGSVNLERDHLRGEVVCRECGMVISSSAIDMGPEWREFDTEQRDRRARAGPPLRSWQKEFSPSTEIGWRDVDSYGRSIPDNNRAQVYRLRKWQRRLRKFRTSQVNLMKGYMEIDRQCQLQGLPPRVSEEAQRIFKMCSERNMIQGRGVECMVAASIYSACRDHGVPRTLNEISSGLNISRKEIGRAYRKMSRELELCIRVTNPSDYISRFCSHLKLSSRTISTALDILKEAESMGYLSGKDPAGIAASAIYIASMVTGQIRTQKEISEATGITEVTIRKRYKEMVQRMEIKLDNHHAQRFMRGS